MQRRLVVLHREHIMPLPLADPLDDLRLAAHRVDRHRATLEVQQLEQFGDRRDLVRLLLARDLAQRQAVLAGPGGDQVQRPQAGPGGERPPLGLAVDGDQLAAGRLVQCLRPAEQIRRELLAVEQPEHAAERVMRRRPARQGQERLQPLELHVGERRHVAPIVRTARHGEDRDRHDIEEQMVAGILVARVLEVGEAPLQTIDKALRIDIHGRVLRLHRREASQHPDHDWRPRARRKRIQDQHFQCKIDA